MLDNLKLSKLLLGFTLLAYLFIVLPNENINVFMIQILLLGGFGVYDLATLLYYLSIWVGPILFCWLIFTRKPIVQSHNKFIWVALLFLFFALCIQHYLSGISLKRYELLIYVIPEIVFLLLAVLILLKTIAIRNANAYLGR